MSDTLEQAVPEGWARGTIGELAEFKYGKSLPQKFREAGQVPVYGSNGIVGTHTTGLIQGPAIIVGRKGTVGAVHFCNGPCWPIDTTYFIDDFSVVEPFFLARLLQSLQMSDLDKSTAIPGLNRNDAYSQEVLVPPLAEQGRIVAQVEALLSRVRSVRQRLAAMPDIFKRFRQAVLAHACSGKLTEDWRSARSEDNATELLQHIHNQRFTRYKANNSTRVRPPIAPAVDGELDLPRGWALASLDQLTCLITSGSRGWAQYYSDDGPLFVRAQNIRTDRLDLYDVAHVAPPASAEGARTQIEKDDLLITITGANVTKSALVPYDLGQAFVSQHVALVRPVMTELSSYLYLWIVSNEHGRAKLERDAYGAGKPGLNLTQIREMPVAVPPLDKQSEIVRRVAGLFALADSVEQRVQAATRQAEALTQSILAKAFRGELVPTEAELARAEGRDYETAEQLLARIREHLVQQKPEKKTQRKTTKRKKVAMQRSPLEILLEAKKKLTPEELFCRSGCDQNDVDTFYEQLRDGIRSSQIVQEPEKPDPKNPKVLLNAKRQ